MPGSTPASASPSDAASARGAGAPGAPGAPAGSGVVGAGPSTARRLGRQRGAMVGLGILLLLVVIALAAPWLSRRDPIRTSPREALRPPGAAHPLGTDQF